MVPLSIAVVNSNRERTVNEMEPYLFDVPMWIVALNPAKDPDTGEFKFSGIGAVQLFGPSSAVALFTEELFAERFSEQNGIIIGEVVQFEDESLLADLLEERRDDGCRLVAFDPQPGRKTERWASIEDIIKRLRA
jgi:hypothetical protein